MFSENFFTVNIGVTQKARRKCRGGITPYIKVYGDVPKIWVYFLANLYEDGYAFWKKYMKFGYEF